MQGPITTFKLFFLLPFFIKKDTYLNKNNFFSSRRSLKNNFNDYGRNISIIMIK